MRQRYVIVGANLAGGTAAITLREEGFDGEIELSGNLEERNAVAFNRGRDLQRAMSLIRARVEVEPAVLQDEGVDLRSLVPGARPARTHQHQIVPHPVARPGEEVK